MDTGQSVDRHDRPSRGWPGHRATGPGKRRAPAIDPTSARLRRWVGESVSRRQDGGVHERETPADGAVRRSDRRRRADATDGVGPNDRPPRLDARWTRDSLSATGYERHADLSNRGHRGARAYASRGHADWRQHAFGVGAPGRTLVPRGA